MEGPSHTSLSPNPLFEQTGEAKPQLLELLNIVGMDLSKNPTPSAQEINTFSQQVLLRKGERWQEQTKQFEPLKDRVFPLLKALTFEETILPSSQEYTGALIHGGLPPTVRLRLGTLIRLWKEGLRIKHLYFLTGERELEEREKTSCANGSSLKTEKDLCQYVWQTADKPQDMQKQVTPHFINALKKEKPRPNTDDTVTTWLESFPQKGPYLVISNQPYIHRQGHITKQITQKNTCEEAFHFDPIGEKINQQLSVAIRLDELARYIYALLETNT